MFEPGMVALVLRRWNFNIQSATGQEKSKVYFMLKTIKGIKIKAANNEC